jgi:hypothetical protein
VTFKVGAQILTYGSTWDEALDVVRSLDDMGYSYIWGHDHLYSTGGNAYQGFFEGWTTLAAWAQATTRARLGLLVGANTFRNPGLVAKMAVTIDHASHGRSILVSAPATSPSRTSPTASIGEDDGPADGLVRGIAGDRRRAPRGRGGHPPLGEVPVREGPPRARPSRRDPRRHRGGRREARAEARRPLRRHLAVVRAVRRRRDVPPQGRGAPGARRAEGRDATTIERMLGAKLILRSDPDEAQRVAEELVAIHKWGPSVWDAVWATTPERAADRLVEFVEAGAHSFSPQIGWPYDRETIESLIGEVVPAVEARIPA